MKFKFVSCMVLPTLFLICIYSCSSDANEFADDSEISMRSPQNRAALIESIGDSDYFLDFIISCNMLNEKMDAYRMTLSQEELNKMMDNTDKESVIEVIKKADVEDEINRIIETRTILKNYVLSSKVNDNEIERLLLECKTIPVESVVKLLKTREEVTRDDCYNTMLKNLELHYSTYYAMSYYCDSDPIPWLCLEMAETFLQQSKDDEARAYKACMDKVRG